MIALNNIMKFRHTPFSFRSNYFVVFNCTYIVIDLIFESHFQRLQFMRKQASNPCTQVESILQCQFEGARFQQMKKILRMKNEWERECHCYAYSEHTSQHYANTVLQTKCILFRMFVCNALFSRSVDSKLKFPICTEVVGRCHTM